MKTFKDECCVWLLAATVFFVAQGQSPLALAFDLDQNPCQQLFEELSPEPSLGENQRIAHCHQVTHPNFSGNAEKVVSSGILCIRKTKDTQQRPILEMVGELEIFEDDLRGRSIQVYSAGYLAERGEAFDGWAVHNEESAVIRQNDQVEREGTRFKVTREIELNKLTQQLLVTENHKRNSLFSPWKTHYSLGMRCGEGL